MYNENTRATGEILDLQQSRRKDGETELLFTYFSEHTAVWFLQRHSLETPRFGKSVSL